MTIFKYAPDTRRIEPAVNAMLDVAKEKSLTIKELLLCLRIVEDVSTETTQVSTQPVNLSYKDEAVMWTLPEKTTEGHVD